jgi:hypothetical protein
MALHSSPTIIERALQALQEYERNQTKPILANPLPAEKNAAASQIFRWVEARCARRDGVWGAEKFLWRDYEAWSQQSKQSTCPRELFRETLDQCFDRRADGWPGIALAIDVAASRYVM